MTAPPGGSAAGSGPDSTDLSPAQLAADQEDLVAGVRGLTQLLAGTSGLAELLTRVADFAVRAVPGADGAGVSMYVGGALDTVVSSVEFVAELDRIQYQLGEGPCVTAAADRRTVRTGSLGGEALWPRFGPQAAQRGVHSALSIPLVLPEDLVGAINIYARGADVFGEHATGLAERFAGPAAVAVHNARVLAETQRTATQLQAALRSRAIIDQAIGIIRSRTGASDQDAFDALRRLSQRDNVKLAHVARQMVDDAVRRARARHADR